MTMNKINIRHCIMISVLLLSITIIPWLNADAAHSMKSQGIEISMTPPVLYQGEICRIDLKPEQNIEILWVKYGNRHLILKPLGSHRYTALVGAGIKEKPGRKKLEIKLSSNDHGSRVITKLITIKTKTYPEEHLKVAKKMVEFPPDILKRVLDDQKAVRNACSRITKDIYWNIPFIWPVKSKILSPFGLRRFFNEKPRSPHSGLDLRARKGTPIKAPNNGRISLVRDCYLSGNTVVINHGGGLYTLYAHLSKVMVKQGQMVNKGDIIGLAGATGRATGPHLHWGVSLFGTRVDPAGLMAILGP